MLIVLVVSFSRSLSGMVGWIVLCGLIACRSICNLLAGVVWWGLSALHVRFCCFGGFMFFVGCIVGLYIVT